MEPMGTASMDRQPLPLGVPWLCFAVYLDSVRSMALVLWDLRCLDSLNLKP